MAKFLDESGVSILWGKVKEKISAEVGAVVGSAPEAFDTLKEVADWIANDESGAAAITSRLGDLENNALSAGDGIVISADHKITYDPEVLATNEYVDANITDTMNFIIQERDTEHAGRVAGDNLKVDKNIVGPNGTAQIFNEADGGGAHFIHQDGTEVFVGVNDGGKNGMMAQIYADELIGGNWVGSRINVYNDKIYYTNKAAVASGVERNNADYEIVVKKDLVGISGSEPEALSSEDIAAICV